MSARRAASARQQISSSRSGSTVNSRPSGACGHWPRGWGARSYRGGVWDRSPARDVAGRLIDRMRARDTGGLVLRCGRGFSETGVHSHLIAHAVHSLTRDMNASTRFVCMPLHPDGGNRVGAANVLAWRTGYPERGEPRPGLSAASGARRSSACDRDSGGAESRRRPDRLGRSGVNAPPGVPRTSLADPLASY